MTSTPAPRQVVTHVADERRWNVECAGKDRYPSEAAADAALAHIRKCGNVRRACWLDSYCCTTCGEWHLGNH